MVDSISGMFDGETCFMNQVIKLAESKPHIMDFTVMRVLEAMFSLVRKGIDNIIEYNDDH
jgi:dynein heavy chain 1